MHRRSAGHTVSHCSNAPSCAINALLFDLMKMHPSLARIEGALATQRATAAAHPAVQQNRNNRPKAVIGAKPQYNSQGLMAAVQQMSVSAFEESEHALRISVWHSDETASTYLAEQVTFGGQREKLAQAFASPHCLIFSHRNKRRCRKP